MLDEIERVIIDEVNRVFHACMGAEKYPASVAEESIKTIKQKITSLIEELLDEIAELPLKEGTILKLEEIRKRNKLNKILNRKEGV